ncbi:MAG: hypothetical protein QM786_05445 [Breznakibacter sp.]
MDKLFLLWGAVLFCAVSCVPGHPGNASSFGHCAEVYPDYANSPIPWNIAPLNFSIRDEGDGFAAAAYSRKGEKLWATGRDVRWDRKGWRQLLDTNRGDTLYTVVYVQKDGQWYSHPAIKNYIAPEGIDPYISYRLIEPSYVVYEQMAIHQRNLTNFEEKVIYSSVPLSDREDGQCINCHAYQDYNRTGRMQFHVRQHKGGTVIVTPEGTKKVDLRTDRTISAGVYPAWHPTRDLIAYSVNNTEQHFHQRGKEKVEVIDSRSDLVLYDVGTNQLRAVACTPDQLETFPAWSPDGSSLYFASAGYPAGTGPRDSLILRYKEFRYNICRKAFDPQTMGFGPAETVFDAAARQRSATLPRISPDGNFLLFTLGDYGNFHIWHKSSDLWAVDLRTGAAFALAEANSPDADSYHSWSSNGRWIIFSSRRDDGSYTRLYIAYFRDGKAFRPFILPREDPRSYAGLFKSFNVPEFMAAPVDVPLNRLVRAVDRQPERVTYVGAASDGALEKAATGNFYE